MFGIFYLQSAYSMLKNTIPLETLVSKAKTNGYDYIVLSDENLYGSYQLFQLAKKYQMRAVLGLRLDVSMDLQNTGFLVYAKNQTGYNHLLKLAYLKTIKEVSFQDLVDHQEGLIIISSGSDSVVDQMLLNDQIDEAFSTLKIFKDRISNFYIGLTLDTFDAEMKVAPKLYQMSEQIGIKLLPIHKTSYIDETQKNAYEALIQIDSDKTQFNEDANYAFLTKVQLQKMFADYSFIFYNAEKLLEQIDFNYDMPKFDMPEYDTNQFPANEYLKSLAVKGLNKRLINKKVNRKDYQERLLYELSIIHKMGYDQYFLIVFDFVRYAKTHDIFVGPGRGSAAGSLVSYCLGITDVDPIEYDLLFERFLNPERISMPDIDMDFPDDKRDEVLSYVQQKYGKEHMISIVTFDTFAVKSSLRDIARVMKIDNQRINGMIKNIVDQNIDPSDEEIMHLIAVAKQIEGLPRHTGTHAAGMILAKQDLTEYIPLQQGSNGFYQSQLEASDLEKLGLLKIDFLGIRNLAIIDDVVQLVKKQEKNFQIQNIPLNDSKVYKLLSQADTFGIFQLESFGMRGVLKKFQPTTFEDIVALLALFRPGPMDFIDEYIARKNGKPFEYLHPKLEPILKSTYGIIVYQEQVMKIANEFAGYTLAEADILRRGIGKKDINILESERVRFIHKCQEKQYDQKVAETIYDYIVKFANYGFNRSHSVSYAFVAYQMAYLKVNYYIQFMTVLLSNVIGNDQLTSDYIKDLQRHHIKVLPPDVNFSTEKYRETKEGILMPLIKIKSFGKVQVEKLIEARSDKVFESYQDFKVRVQSILNQKNIEMLIYANALSMFGLNQHTLFEHKDTNFAGYEQYVKDYQMQMFEEYDFGILAEHEKEALGFNLLYHPLIAYQDIIDKNQLDSLEVLSSKSSAKVLAMIAHVKVITTKNNQKMAFLALDDGQAQIEATIFPDTYEKYKQFINKNVKVLVIKENTYQNKKTYIIEKITEIKDLPK